MTEPTMSFDPYLLQNRALELSYRFGVACWAALYAWPLCLLITYALIVITDHHDTPPGADIVIWIFSLAVVLPGLAGTILAIAGATSVYAQGGGGRNAISAGFWRILASSPALVFIAVYLLTNALLH